MIILFGLFVSSAFLLYRSLLDATAAGVVVLFLFAFGYIFAKRITAFRVAWRTAPDDPPEANDWKRSRDTTTTVAVALLVAIVGAALMVGLWTSLRALVLAILVPFGVFQTGLVLRLYGFHRLGMRVL